MYVLARDASVGRPPTLTRHLCEEEASRSLFDLPPWPHATTRRSSSGSGWLAGRPRRNADDCSAPFLVSVRCMGRRDLQGGLVIDVNHRSQEDRCALAGTGTTAAAHPLWAPRRRCLPGNSTFEWHTHCRVRASTLLNVFSSVHRLQRTFCLRAL